MLETSARLLALLSLLQMRREWAGQELADRLEVGPRTIRRDVDKLRSLGYPIESAPGIAGGYRLGSGAQLPPLLLEDAEAVAVAVGLRTAAAGSITGIEETSVRALAKLEQVLPSSPAPPGPRARRRHLGLHGRGPAGRRRPAGHAWRARAATARGCALPTWPRTAPRASARSTPPRSCTAAVTGTWSPSTWAARIGAPSVWIASAAACARASEACAARFRAAIRPPTCAASCASATPARPRRRAGRIRVSLPAQDVRAAHPRALRRDRARRRGGLCRDLDRTVVAELPGLDGPARPPDAGARPARARRGGANAGQPSGARGLTARVGTRTPPTHAARPRALARGHPPGLALSIGHHVRAGTCAGLRHALRTRSGRSRT